MQHSRYQLHIDLEAAARAFADRGESSGHQESDVIELILNVPAPDCVLAPNLTNPILVTLVTYLLQKNV